jgi:hypothetical protein
MEHHDLSLLSYDGELETQWKRIFVADFRFKIEFCLPCYPCSSLVERLPTHFHCGVRCAMTARILNEGRGATGHQNANDYRGHGNK